MGRSTNGNGAEDERHLIRFLQHPDDRDACMPFFQLCHKLAVGSLGYLQRRGYRLPVGPHNSFSSNSDLAIDILGTFLRFEKGVRFGVIFRYFSKEGISDFADADPSLVMSKFRALLLGYVRKELFRINQQEYPEAADLKTRLNRILSGEQYASISFNGCSDLICLAVIRDVEMGNKPFIPQDKLEYLAEEAYVSSRTIEEWCAKIFALLALREEYLPAIPRHQVLAAAVKISGTHLEIDAMPPSALPGPEQLLLSSDLVKLREEVVEFVAVEVISRFIKQGRISKDTGARFERAVDLFLADKSNGDQVDLLPSYFRETMPELEHKHYLNRYKYVFETIMSRAEEEFIDRIKKKFQ